MSTYKEGFVYLYLICVKLEGPSMSDIKDIMTYKGIPTYKNLVVCIFAECVEV